MIEVQNLSKVYGDYRAVDDLSFKVEKGEILGFLGPNGAGKTTTMRILTCFMAPTNGTARIAGHDILEDSLEVRRQIGYLPETAPLYPEMSVRGYLGHIAAIRGVPKARRNERIEAALDAGKLEDRADTLIRKLSKGYRQRVGIAQAVIHDPPVLILDEPSAGLDPRQRAETRRFIKSLAKDHTIILSTHILPDVQETCSRVIIIDQGKIVAQDSTENLAKSRGESEHIEVTLLRAPGNALQMMQELASVESGQLGSDQQQNDQQQNSKGVGGSTFLLNVADGADAREDVARLCVDSNWGLVELSRHRTSLEETFLQLTTQDE